MCKVCAWLEEVQTFWEGLTPVEPCCSPSQPFRCQAVLTLVLTVLRAAQPHVLCGLVREPFPGEMGAKRSPESGSLIALVGGWAADCCSQEAVCFTRSRSRKSPCQRSPFHTDPSLLLAEAELHPVPLCGHFFWRKSCFCDTYLSPGHLARGQLWQWKKGWISSR